jgi:hypothetical protein
MLAVNFLELRKGEVRRIPQPVEKLARGESAKPASQLAWPPVPRRRPRHHDGHQGTLLLPATPRPLA